MRIGRLQSLAVVMMVCGLLPSCSTPGVRLPQAYQHDVGPEAPGKYGSSRKDISVPEPVVKTGWTERRVTKRELLDLREKDKDLDLLTCYDILARLNIKSSSHISRDVYAGSPLKVPDDFRAYKDWTPLPRFLSGVADTSKFILVAKDIPFIGWYERGELSGDSQVCIGREWKMTEAGMYKVLEKDADHYSKSYKNEFGDPAGMPWALRIYDVVWIHGGDVTDGYCSPGCVYLPVDKAEELFRWAETGTAVLIVDTLKELDEALESRSARRAAR